MPTRSITHHEQPDGQRRVPGDKRDAEPNRWETLARENAEFYIKTDLAAGDEFFASGERDAAHIVTLCARFLPAQSAPHSAALEIGCGIGRLTLPMARRFGRVVAVDIAPTMLRRLAENCAARGTTNVTPRLAAEAWERDGPIDFAYSRIVFQHIAAWSAVDDYLRRISRCLSQSGICYAQFDTRPATPLYHLKNALPDAVLPRTWRRGVRRIRRGMASIRDSAASAGLSVLLERGAGTYDTELVFGKAGSGPPAR